MCVRVCDHYPFWVCMCPVPPICFDFFAALRPATTKRRRLFMSCLCVSFFQHEIFYVSLPFPFYNRKYFKIVFTSCVFFSFWFRFTFQLQISFYFCNAYQLQVWFYLFFDCLSNPFRFKHRNKALPKRVIFVSTLRF